jgi:BirA family biotin operon repressor/biotin-[acetyl-CoA-carboxylase] ligase
MRPPQGAIEVHDSLPSTQETLCSYVRAGRRDVAAIIALRQTAGRGRLGRTWISPEGSLSLTMALFDYANWPTPQFIGMAVAIAAAEVLDCDLAWPNDLMVEGSLKAGGVLSEMVVCDGVRIPVVGVGANLQTKPEGLAFAGAVGCELSPRGAAEAIIAGFSEIPEPDAWQTLRSRWMARDVTPLKEYRLPDGRLGVAQGIGDGGELIVMADGEPVILPSAEAWFGDQQ